MSFCIVKTHTNGYRCGCCRSDADNDPIWTDSWDEALTHLPTEFPVHNEFGGCIEVTITDGATGQTVAHSEVTWPPAYQRGDGYKYTKWDLYIQGGRCIEQIIKGVRSTGLVYNPEDPPPLEEVLVKGREWNEILDELSKKADQARIKKLEAELEKTKKQLESLRG